VLAERLTSQLSRVLGLYSRAESVAATRRGPNPNRDDNRDGNSETSCFGVSSELFRRQTTHRHCAKSREIDRSGSSSQISLIELVGESR